MADENVVLVGEKDSKYYVFAVLAQLRQGATAISIKARGRKISKAVDVAQIALNKFLQGWKVDNIQIGTEERDFTEEQKKQNPSLKDRKLRVSTIEIKLMKT